MKIREVIPFSQNTNSAFEARKWSCLIMRRYKVMKLMIISCATYSGLFNNSLNQRKSGIYNNFTFSCNVLNLLYSSLNHLS